MTRKIYRHESNKGSVIEFDFYGRPMKLFVPDAKYRLSNLFQWGMDGQKIPELQNFDQDEKHMYWRCPLFDFEPLPTSSDDTHLQTRFPSFRADLTAKESTDILMKYSDTPAAHACRNTDIGLGPMDLPNIYELMVIFQCSDALDSLDPTFNDFKDKGLGCKSTYGRFDWLDSGYIWASTSYSNGRARGMDCNTGVKSHTRMYEGGVLPVLEL